MTTVKPTRSTTVNCDASFCPNTRAAGWAVWAAIDGGVKVKMSGKFKRRPKNATDAEYLAMCNGIWIALQHDVTHILVQGDCKAALRRVDLRSKEVSMMLEGTGVVLKTKWVKAHKRTDTARHWVNGWCDKQAKIHMREQRKSS